MLKYVFFIIILITQTYKTKIITITRYHSEAIVERFSVRKGVLRNFTKFTGKHLCQYLGKGEKNKLKQCEIEVKMIVKMKKQFKLRLVNSFYERY